MRNSGGYVAIDRGIFEHPMFNRRQRLSRLEAWEWLIATAAWKPRGVRTDRGIAHLERGQLAISVRSLGKTWGWPKSNVERFIRRLALEEMIAFQKSGTPTGTPTGTPITIITICNYDKFQNGCEKVGHQPGHQPGQDEPQLPGITAQSAPKPLNQPTIEVRQEVDKSGGEGKRRLNAAPPDGATNGRVIFARVGGELWAIYAVDFKTVTGTEPLPKRYDDGISGRWFKRNGQAAPMPPNRMREARSA